MNKLVILSIGFILIAACTKKKDWDTMVRGEWLASEWVSFDPDDSSSVDYVQDLGYFYFITFEKCKSSSTSSSCECRWRIEPPDAPIQTFSYYFEILPSDSLLFMIDKYDENVSETWKIKSISKDRIEMKRIFHIPGFDDEVVLERY